MTVVSRESLKEHCLRSLGKPVINIELADEQIDDIIDDVIQLYRERIYDGVEEVFLKYQITQTDIDNANSLVLDNNVLPYKSNNNFIILPEYITSIIDVLSINNSSVGDMFGRSLEFFARENLLYNNRGTQFDIVSIPIMNEYLGAIKHLTKPETRCRFNYNTGKLYIDTDINKMLNSYIVIHCNKWIYPEQYRNMYNSRFIKELTTIKMKLQWGSNLIKFKDMSLPGGIKYDSAQIYNSAKTELDEFMKRISVDWETMPFMLIG